MKTLVVVGAGAGLGYSVAERFGGDPDLLAEEFWRMCLERNRFETVVGDLELVEQSLRDHEGA